MTIHFRSRTKSPVDYTQQLFPGTRGCCCTGSNDLSLESLTAFPYQTSYGECNAVGGHFRIVGDDEGCGDVVCLSKGKTGCCCACSYGGMTEGVEYDVCQDLDGTWVEGSCPEDPDVFCINSSGRDVRLKRACCGYTLSGGEIVANCFDVCTEKDCFDLRSGELASTFYPVGGNCSEVNPNCSSPQISSMNSDRTEILGNCCVQGFPCKCYKNVSLDECESINGSFYLTGDPEFSCSDCISNCSGVD